MICAECGKARPDTYWHCSKCHRSFRTRWSYRAHKCLVLTANTTRKKETY